MRRLWAGLVFGCVAALLASCAMPTGSSASVPAEENTEETEHVLTMVALSSVGNVLEQAVEEFNRDNPYGASIELTTYGMSAYKQMFSTSAAINEVPDLFFTWEAGYLEPFVQRGKVLELEELSAGEGTWYDSFKPGVFDNLTFDGKVYAVPLQEVMVVVVYNRDLFAELGVTPPETWQEFVDLCGTFRAAGITPLAVNRSGSWEAGQLLMTLLAGSGGCGLYTDMKTSDDWTDERLLDAMQTLEQLYTLGYTGDDGAYTSQTQALIEGEAAMALMGSWDLTRLAEREDMGVFLLPAKAEECAGTVVGSVDQCYGISADCQDPEAALAFLKLLSGEKYQRELAEASGQVPAIQLEDYRMEDPLMAEVQDLYQQVTARILWADRGFGHKKGEALNRAALAVLNGDSADEQAEILAETVRGAS